MVLVNYRQLLDQWLARLQEFLNIPLTGVVLMAVRRWSLPNARIISTRLPEGFVTAYQIDAARRLHSASGRDPHSSIGLYCHGVSRASDVG